MEPYYDDGDERMFGDSEYPDPDYTPSLPWVGPRGPALLEEEFKDVHDEAEPALSNRSVSSTALDHLTNRSPSRLPNKSNDSSVDPDSDFRDDEET